MDYHRFVAAITLAVGAYMVRTASNNRDDDYYEDDEYEDYEEDYEDYSHLISQNRDNASIRYLES